MTRKVCVITGTRAEYGLLRRVIKGVKDAADLQLQLVVTGMHLSPEFGSTWHEVEADGFTIDRKVEMLLSSDTPSGIAKSMGLAMIGFASAFSELKPDVLVVLGDRFEIFAAVSAALVARIPVAHLHGGETSEGAIDEALRHAITKMSHLHFVAAEPYRRRVLQLGEQPDRVFLVGGLGVDSIKHLALFDRHALEGSLGITFGERNLLVTFHPATLERDSAAQQMASLLDALSERGDTELIFTLPNADTESRGLIAMIEDYARAHSNAHVFKSLGQLRYLSCVAQVDGVVGNSSSGLTEVPTFKKGTINIGDRQRGRLMAESVINCRPTHGDIAAALATLYSSEFQLRLRTVRNPYGEGGASESIVEVLRQVDLGDLVKKVFRDSPPMSAEGVEKSR